VKRICKIIAALFIIAAMFSARIVPAPAWQSLFNGKDLSGWKNNESTANKYGYLATKKAYRNFDLRLKFKSEAEANSGVFLRSKITGVDAEHGPDIEGMRVEVDPRVGKRTGGLYESGGRGWVALPTRLAKKRCSPGHGTTWEFPCMTITS
jgi:3-keto-disaccharide hydrolase